MIYNVEEPRKEFDAQLRSMTKELKVIPNELFGNTELLEEDFKKINSFQSLRNYLENIYLLRIGNLNYLNQDYTWEDYYEAFELDCIRDRFKCLGYDIRPLYDAYSLRSELV